MTNSLDAERIWICWIDCKFPAEGMRATSPIEPSEECVFLESGAMPAGSLTEMRRLNLLFKQGELALRTNDFASAEQFFAESLKSTPPRIRLTASIMIDFPAPVSPVRMFSPGPNAT